MGAASRESGTDSNADFNTDTAGASQSCSHLRTYAVAQPYALSDGVASCYRIALANTELYAGNDDASADSYSD